MRKACGIGIDCTAPPVSSATTSVRPVVIALEIVEADAEREAGRRVPV